MRPKRMRNAAVYFHYDDATGNQYMLALWRSRSERWESETFRNGGSVFTGDHVDRQHHLDNFRVYVTSDIRNAKEA